MLSRCNRHVDGGGPQERKGGYTYVAAVQPIGYPNQTAAICGRSDCENSGLIFLDDHQYWRFQYQDERVFGVHKRHDVAIRVTDRVARERTEIARPEEYGPDEHGCWPKYPGQEYVNEVDWPS